MLEDTDGTPAPSFPGGGKGIVMEVNQEFNVIKHSLNVLSRWLTPLCYADACSLVLMTLRRYVHVQNFMMLGFVLPDKTWTMILYGPSALHAGRSTVGSLHEGRSTEGFADLFSY